MLLLINIKPWSLLQDFHYTAEDSQNHWASHQDIHRRVQYTPGQNRSRVQYQTTVSPAIFRGMAPRSNEVTVLSATTSATSKTDSYRSNSIGSSHGDESKRNSSALNIVKSLAKHLTRVPSKSSSRNKAPDMSKMRTVTPVYDHELKRWVFPTPCIQHRDEPTPLGSACKQLPNPAAKAVAKASRSS